jgi:uncharacterized membrane protein YbhN (UPF0104 family)
VTGQPSTRRRRAAALVFVAAAVAAALVAIARDRSAVEAALGRVDPTDLALSVGLAVLGVSATFVMWRALLSGLGVTVATSTASRMFFVAQLGKYLPGSVWPLVAQLEYGRRAGLDRKAVLAANLLALAFGTGTGLLMSLGLFFSSTWGSHRWWFLLLLPPALTMLHPKTVLATLNFALTRLHRPTLDIALPWSTVMTAAAWGAVSWLLLGAHLVVLLHAMDAATATDSAVVIASFALATCTGMIVVFAPVGLGVRDGMLVALIGPIAGTAPAITAALLSRLVLTISDLLLALVATWHRSDGTD